jgi:hypothetical protein
MIDDTSKLVWSAVFGPKFEKKLSYWSIGAACDLVERNDDIPYGLSDVLSLKRNAFSKFLPQ